MENSAPVIFAFTPPILYATTAVVITAAAVVFGYLYTQKASKDVSREVAGDTTNTKQQDGQVKSSGVETDNKEASVLSGSWPSNADEDLIVTDEEVEEVGDEEVEDEEDQDEEEDPANKVYEIPHDAPEQMKKLLEMGFPGCPLFRQTAQAVASNKAGQLAPGRIPLSQILGFPVDEAAMNQVTPYEKKAAMNVSKILKKGEANANKKAENSNRAHVEKKAKVKTPDAKKSETNKTETKKLEAKKPDEKKQAIKPKMPKTATTDTKKKSEAQIKTLEAGKKDESAPERDPVEFCSHLQSEVKRTQQKVAIQKIEEEMTPEQKENEREIQRQQLESIFKLMHSQEEKFGVDSMEDIQSQMKLYM